MSSVEKEVTKDSKEQKELHLSKKAKLTAKTSEDKPPDSAVKSAVHLTGAKFTNTWLSCPLAMTDGLYALFAKMVLSLGFYVLMVLQA